MNLLKSELKTRNKDDKNTMMMFTDSYDVILAAGADTILGTVRIVSFS